MTTNGADGTAASSGLEGEPPATKQAKLMNTYPTAPPEEWPEAWMLPDVVEDPGSPNQQDPNVPVTVEQLKTIGIEYWKMDHPSCYTYPTLAVPWDPKDAMDPKLKALRDDRGYSYADIITIHPDHLPEFEKKIAMFLEEHVHDAEEIRYILAGSGYFDVRDARDKWVRIHVKAGDLITLPEGIYHRFTCDPNKFIHAMRLFIGQPVWTPFNRPQADEHPSRKEYLQQYVRPQQTPKTTTNTTPAAAAPGTYANKDGLEYIKLVHPITGASSEIYLYGACVTSFRDGQGTEFIALRPDAKLDGSKPISGGLSHCWPQFGPGHNMQQHGFARNVTWTVQQQQPPAPQSDIKVTLVLETSDYTKAMWDKSFLVTFTVELEENQLNTTMVVENNGTESFDFQAALHSYFRVSSLKNIQITGSFAGKEFLDKLVNGGGTMQTEDRDTITIDQAYDRVYKQVTHPVLKDTGTGKALSVVNSKGWQDTVLWNPYGNQTMGYDTFVCVESVKYDPVPLAAGETWTATMSLVPKPLE